MPSLIPRPWQRFGVRVAAGFAAVTLLGIGLVGWVIYQEQKRTLETTLGRQLLNIARTGALAIDSTLHAEVEATGTQDSEAYRRLRETLVAIQDANDVATPIYTLTDFDPAARQARFMVSSRGPGGLPGEPYALAPMLLEPLERAFRQGVAAHTRVYENQHGTWLTAFAPVRDGTGRVFAVLDVDYRVDVYLDRLVGLRNRILGASAVGGLVALAAGLLIARRVTGPVSALTHGVVRVAGGDLSQPIPVQSEDEVGQLTQAFNEMLEGLRQRDFIRDTFGRYVSPEVVQAVLESPGGLRLGGEKRDVTVLLSDLRGYTRLAEEGDATTVVQVLNGYLGRMTEIIIEHGGTIGDFFGDGIFAVFGAPFRHEDHAERAAGCAIAMQLAMEDVNRRHAARGLPQLDMGVGLNTGEGVVGNIGSEQRTKYSVVGGVVNLAARVEACTVGGQVLMSASTHERIRDIAEVGPPFPVEVKGVREPLMLYDLRGLSGPYGRRMLEVAASGEPDTGVTLALRAWLLEEGAIVSEEVTGEATRLGARSLQARVTVPLPALGNVRLRLHYPALARESADLYGKVLSVEAQGGVWLARIGLTSVNEADQRILEELRRVGGVSLPGRLGGAKPPPGKAGS